MIFQEAIQHIRETGKKAYVALLDVRKAFDTVWHDGLFHKLFQIGIKDHTYLEATEKVVLVVVVLCSMEGHMLQTIPNQPRSQAGGYIISPFIYDLLEEPQQSNLGAKMGEIYCGAPAYANDLALVASTPEELQKMLDIVHTYSNKWRYRLDASK